MEKSKTEGKIGVFTLVFFVVAAASPLTGVVGGQPMAMTMGNGAGVPGVYFLAGLILLIFSVGFITMSRYVKNGGAFYAYISKGLGRRLGISGLGLVILTYVSIYLTVAAIFGLFTHVFFQEYLGVDLPWWLYTMVMLLVVCWLGIERIEIGGRVLGVLMLLEVGVALLISAAVIVHTALYGHLDFTPFSPSVVFQGRVGISMVFGLAGFIGFEATAIYTEECRHPEKTIPKATVIAVLLITAFFVFCGWGLIQAYGAQHIQAEVAKNPDMFVFHVAEQYLGKWILIVINLLLITSLFAASQSFHNNIARYFYRMAKDHLYWQSLGKLHPTKNSPYMAVIYETITMLLMFVVLVLMGSDPMKDIFTWGSAIATMSVLVLQILVSCAVVVFFNKNPALGQPAWKVLWMPILAVVCMLLALGVVLFNLHEISGVGSEWVYLIPCAVFGSAVAGFLYAVLVKRYKPEIFSKLDELVEKA